MALVGERFVRAAVIVWRERQTISSRLTTPANARMRRLPPHVNVPPRSNHVCVARTYISALSDATYSPYLSVLSLLHVVPRTGRMFGLGVIMAAWRFFVAGSGFAIKHNAVVGRKQLRLGRVQRTGLAAATLPDTFLCGGCPCCAGAARWQQRRQ